MDSVSGLWLLIKIKNGYRANLQIIMKENCRRKSEINIIIQIRDLKISSSLRKPEKPKTPLSQRKSTPKKQGGANKEGEATNPISAEIDDAAKKTADDEAKLKAEEEHKAKLVSSPLVLAFEKRNYFAGWDLTSRFHPLSWRVSIALQSESKCSKMNKLQAKRIY